MSTETNAAPTETKPKTTHKRASKPSTVATFLDKTRAEMTAKVKELDKEVKNIHGQLNIVDDSRNVLAADLMRITSERDRVVAGLAAIDKAVDLSGVTAKNDTPVESVSNTRKKPRKYAKLTQEVADAIRAASGMQEEIAARYGCSVAMVSRIKSGQCWAPKS